MKKLRVLFVDDEPMVLQGLRRMLRPQHRAWDMVFAASGSEALELLAQAPFDVLVTDMRMPGMDGVRLLSQVRELYPHMVRLILSGQADPEMVFKSVSLAHQYLNKPCDAETLKTAIERAWRLRPLLTDGALLKVVAGLDSLPSLPALYAELVQESQSPYASLEKIGEIISRDLGMTAKILQLVNSAFFGYCRHVASPAQAVQLLGLETIKNLALTCQVFARFDCSRAPGFSLQDLWNHSLATGRLAQIIAGQESLAPQTVDQAFMAGLLHDAGKLILAANFPQKYQEVLALCRNNKISFWSAELESFGVSHAEVGAYLLGLWGLPDTIVEAVAYHHQPGKSGQKALSPLTAVHVANAWKALQPAPQVDTLEAGCDRDYLSSLEVIDKLPHWQSLCQETLKIWQQQ